MSETSADPFRAAMRETALALLGEPNPHMTTKSEMRFGTHGSLSINLNDGTFYDHEAQEGGGTLALVERHLSCSRAEAVRWMESHQLIPPRRAPEPTKQQWGKQIAHYDYVDENGARLFQVVKLDPPHPARFVQRHEENGEWKWGTKGIRRVLYRLPDVLAREGSFIVIAEGEKDVDRLWANGIPATCNPGGAGKWLAEYNEALRGADVLIVPDNDEAGRKHRDVVAQSLDAVAASVRVLYLPALPAKGDVSDWFDAGGTRNDFLKLADGARPIRDSEPAQSRFFDPTPFSRSLINNVKAREWIYGNWCVRDYVALIGSPGGVGKTAYTISVALSIAAGVPLLDERVPHAAGAWIFNLEDDADEMVRRAEAAMEYHKLTDADIAGRLFVDSGEGAEQPLCIATRGDKGNPVATPDVDAMVDALRRRNISVLFVDPFVRSHALEENNNGEMDFAAKCWKRVAKRANCSVVLVHHFRKGAEAGDVDAFRGGSALKDAGRSALGLQKMTPEEAIRLALPEERRLSIIRIDNLKANMAPPMEHRRYIELTNVRVASGDEVQVARPFEPPGAFGKLQTADNANRVLSAIDAGQPDSDLLWCNDPRSVDWVGPCFIATAKALGVTVTDAEVARMIREWLQNGVLEFHDYRNRDRKTKKGLRVNANKRPGVMED